MNKKNAIMMSFNDPYTFTAANVMLSIKENSPKVFDMCEFIIYHNGITKINQETLLKIKREISFIEMSRDLPSILYTHHTLHLWGEYILQKFHSFELLKTYKRILWIETDIYVSGELDYLFDASFDIAYKPGGGGGGQRAYPHLLKNKEDNPLGPHCAVVVFNDSLLKFNIGLEEMSARAYEVMKDNKRGGSIDETFLSYLVYYYNMDLLCLTPKYNANLPFNPYGVFNTAIQHFGGKYKPWKEDYIYRMFPKWSDNYFKFIELGGGNYPKFDDINNFFGNEYSMDVLRYMSILRPIYSNLDITRDTLFYFDFFKSSKNPRFNFRKLINLLFIELVASYSSANLEICLTMDTKLDNKKHKALFKSFYSGLKAKFENAQLKELTEGGISISITYRDIRQTNNILNEIISQSKQRLYPYITYLDKTSQKQRVLRGIIKALVDKKKYKKLKQNPSLFFDDSKSSFIKLLGRYYF